jgi:hypothetical protein
VSDYYDRLRATTARLLGFDLAKLTFRQLMRLDRAVALQLQVNDLKERQLDGDKIDISQLVTASQALEDLVAQSNGDAAVDTAAARTKFEALLDNYVEAKKTEDEEKIEQLEREVAELQAALAEAKAALANTPLPQPLPENVVPHPAAQPAMSADEKMARANANRQPPGHYLCGPAEPWRPYVGVDGPIAPWDR